jgi:hypothetical protein
MIQYQYEEIYKTIKVKHFTEYSASSVPSFTGLLPVRYKGRIEKDMRQR